MTDSCPKHKHDPAHSVTSNIFTFATYSPSSWATNNVPNATMKTALLTFIIVTICLLGLVIAAQTPEKSIIVSFPSGIGDDVVARARLAVYEAGGFITHEYKIFK